MKRSLESMNIAIVHDWLTNVAGSEKVLLALKEIFPDATIFTSVFDSKKAAPFKDFDIRTSVLQKLPFMKSKRDINRLNIAKSFKILKVVKNYWKEK